MSDSHSSEQMLFLYWGSSFCFLYCSASSPETGQHCLKW